MPRRFPFLQVAAALALALGASACSTPCRDLGDRICGCVPEGQTRTTCTNSVKSRVSEAGATDAQQSYCESLLSTCPDPASNASACDYMQTCRGKVACGMALPQPDAPPDGGGCLPVPSGGGDPAASF